MNYKNRITDIEQLNREIEPFRPISNPHVLRQLKDYFRIGLTYASNALEGNSLTETETKIVIEDGITVGGKPLRDHFEAIGHSEAYDFVYKVAKKDSITENDIRKLHRLFYYRIDSTNAGRYRRKKIIITGTDYIPPPPNEISESMKVFIEQIAFKRSTIHPVEFAAYLHLELVSIHPYIDGNGRTARLLMNMGLMQTGYVMSIIPPVLRNDYLTSLRLAQTGQKDERLFINFITNVVYESTKDYLRLLRSLV